MWVFVAVRAEGILFFFFPRTPFSFSHARTPFSNARTPFSFFNELLFLFSWPFQPFQQLGDRTCSVSRFSSYSSYVIEHVLCAVSPF